MSKASDNRAAWLLRLGLAERQALLARMSQRQRLALRHHWHLWAHAGQLPPAGQWQTWLILAGRGFGKTRAGAEWVRARAQADPAARIALVGATLGEARSVMVEGESGLLAIAPRGMRPRFEPSRRLLTWPNGAQAMLYSAGEPESLRGPQQSHAWCDEIAKWDNAGGKAEAAWDNLQLGLRLGRQPQVVATTTPRAVPLVKRLLDGGEAQVTRGSTYANKANLAVGFVRAVRRQYGKLPGRPRRKPSSTKAWSGSTPWSAARSRPQGRPRPLPPRMASAGWLQTVHQEPGPDVRVPSPFSSKASGCSSCRRTACKFSTVRPARSSTTQALGAWLQSLLCRPAARPWTHRREQQLPP